MFQFTASTDFFVGNYLYAHLYLSNFYVLKLDEFQYTHICMLTYIKRKGQEKMFRRFSTQPVPIFFSRIICMLNITLHCTIITTPYGINVDYQNGDVYIADAKNYVSAGSVTCFSSAGVNKFSFSVAPGVNPNKIVFRR
jgi:hypothetical protein